MANTHKHVWEDAWGASCVECHVDLIAYAEAAQERIAALEAENAKLWPIVEEVANSETRHAEIVDRWVLAFENPTLSAVQTIWHTARDLVKARKPKDPLARTGVHFTPEQVAQVTTLIEAGNVVAAQKIILDVLAAWERKGE